MSLSDIIIKLAVILILINPFKIIYMFLINKAIFALLPIMIIIMKGLIISYIMLLIFFLIKRPLHHRHYLYGCFKGMQNSCCLTCQSFNGWSMCWDDSQLLPHQNLFIYLFILEFISMCAKLTATVVFMGG